MNGGVPESAETLAVTEITVNETPDKTHLVGRLYENPAPAAELVKLGRELLAA